MGERVTRVEQIVECLPGMKTDLRAIRTKLDRDDGRDGTLRVIIGLIVGSGIIGPVIAVIIATHH